MPRIVIPAPGDGVLIAHGDMTGLDIGRDRGSPVSHYAAPFAFTGKLGKVTVTIGDGQSLDGEAAGRAEMGRQ
ncbi:MAG: hypothetical protein K2X43_06610 [Hyphomonadaceae bacterium]|jgi:arylsulfatase|nr:hypothetical protein [Hyphomonadaceae bacterium]